MDITINHISLRAKSSLNTISDTCAICRENVCDGCIKCQQNNVNLDSNQAKQCFSVLGTCNHSYHYCCIQNWSNQSTYTSKKCPMCNKNWELKKRTIITSKNKTQNNYNNINN